MKETLEIWIPLAVAVFTVIAGLLSYSYHRMVDRKNTLIGLRRNVYRDFLISIVDVAERPHDAGAILSYRKKKVELFLTASDEVVRTSAAFTGLFGGTGGDPKERAARFADMARAMRRDGYEETRLAESELVAMAPVRFGDDEGLA